MTEPPLTPKSWLSILASAYRIFEDAEARGLGTPPFSLGGGTVLMLEFRHRLSKDIDFFGYDAQWLSILTPRLNETAAALATTYAEQANHVKIVMPHGDIDFIVAADVALPVKRGKRMVAGRDIEIEPCSEILAKKLFYRASSLAARDIYDMSAAIDLQPAAAAFAARAARPKRDVMMRRFEELRMVGEAAMLDGIVPYDGRLPHAAGMLGKVSDFVLRQTSVALDLRSDESP